jgi:hypothetical protein
VTISLSKRLGILAATVAVALAACGGPGTTTGPTTGATPGAATGAPLSGTINIDGSSTVYPVTEAVAEEFLKRRGDPAPGAAPPQQFQQSITFLHPDGRRVNVRREAEERAKQQEKAGESK